MAEKEVCRGQCLVGKCPFPVCIKYKNKGKRARGEKVSMNMLTQFTLPSGVTSDKTGKGIAVDIGTTTIAMLLYSLDDAKLIAVESAVNEQTRFGLDVISRIKYCDDNPDGLGDLNDSITGQLNGMIRTLLEKADARMDEITYMVATGNTTMLHLLCNLSPVSMGMLPFEPASHFGETMRAGDIGLAPGCGLYLPPCISAFVGADVATGMLYTGFADSGGIDMLLDIGTNGEVALGDRHRLMVTSTAAGPAFEGAHISCGMAGVPGAVSAVQTMDHRLVVETVGGKAPAGICGSGLLDAIAVFRNAGAIDETGMIGEDNDFYIEVDGQGALRVTDGVHITQKDIREFQTAKAAIAAGVQTLIHEFGAKADEIGTLFIAGGFGNYMDADSARTLGLVPGGIPLKSVGNAASGGAAMLLLNDRYKESVTLLAQAAEHVELGGNPYFMEQYIDMMTI